MQKNKINFPISENLAEKQYKLSDFGKLLTCDRFTLGDYEGIEVRSVVDWLL